MSLSKTVKPVKARSIPILITLESGKLEKVIPSKMDKWLPCHGRQGYKIKRGKGKRIISKRLERDKIKIFQIIFHYAVY